MIIILNSFYLIQRLFLKYDENFLFLLNGLYFSFFVAILNSIKIKYINILSYNEYLKQ